MTTRAPVLTRCQREAAALLGQGEVARERSGAGQARTWVFTSGRAFSDDTIRALYAAGVATDEICDRQIVVVGR